MTMREDAIGGAYVRRWCSLGKPGDHLDAWEVSKIPPGNRLALVRTGCLELYPASPKPKDESETGKLHLVSLGFGKFNVIRGEIVNREPISKEDAQMIIERDG